MLIVVMGFFQAMSVVNKKIKVIDVGVVFDGGGVIFGFSLLFFVIFMPPEFRWLILSSVGVLLILSGLFVFFKMYRVKNARPIPGELRGILVERFRRPGPAGVMARFRIKVEMVCEGSDVKQSFVSFASDNYYEVLDDALLDLAAAVDLKSFYFDRIFGIFVFNRIGGKIFSSALALIFSGLILVFVGYGVQLLINF